MLKDTRPTGGRRVSVQSPVTESDSSSLPKALCSACARPPAKDPASGPIGLRTHLASLFIINLAAGEAGEMSSGARTNLVS